jgi:RalA-binding protein 1
MWLWHIRYVPPLKPVTSRWSLELPDSPSAIEEELKKQESLLNHLHEELMNVKDMNKEEQLWEVQRVVTQLKRKVRSLVYR